MPSDPRDSSSSSTRDGWLRDVTLLLRLRGIDGVHIGESLAKVETFCDDTGQQPKDVFGEPASYVATLRFSSPRAVSWRTAVILPVLGLVIGVDLGLGAVLHWSAGVAITLGLVASMLVFVGFVVMLLMFVTKIITRRGGLAVWFGAGLGAMLLLPLLLRYELARIPSAVALLLGVSIVAFGVTVVRRIPGDPVVARRVL
jgi:hypothetical protein